VNDRLGDDAQTVAFVICLLQTHHWGCKNTWHRPVLVNSLLWALRWGMIGQYQLCCWAGDSVQHGPGILADLTAAITAP